MCIRGAFPFKVRQEILNFYKNEIDELLKLEEVKLEKNFNDKILYMIPHLVARNIYKICDELKLGDPYEYNNHNNHFILDDNIKRYELIHIKPVSDLLSCTVFLISDNEIPPDKYWSYLGSILNLHSEEMKSYEQIIKVKTK